KFFNEARSKLSFPSADQYTPEEYNLDALQSDSATKLKAAIEIMLRVLRHGADNTFPSEFHSTTDRVVDAADIGLPNFLSGWEVNHFFPTSPGLQMKKLSSSQLTRNFIPGCRIGAVSSKERTRFIEEFRLGPVDVLIMSQFRKPLGRQLTLNKQLVEFIDELVADKTVEVLLIATGLGKRFLLGTFLELERNLKTFKMLAGHAGEEYEALTKGVDAGDDVAEEVRQNLKSAQSALGVALQDRFKEAEELPTPKGKQPATVSKKRARKAESTADKEEDNDEGHSKKKAKSSKVKSAEFVHDKSPARSMRLAAGPSQINATAGSSSLNAPPPSPPEGPEPLDPAENQELARHRAAEFRKVIAAKLEEARANAEATSNSSQAAPVQSGTMLGPVLPFIAPGETLHHLPSPPPIPQIISAPADPSIHSPPPMDPPNLFEHIDFEPVETPTAPVSPQLPTANIPGMSDLSSLASPTPSPPLVEPHDAPAMGSDGRLKDASEIEFTYSESEDAPAPKISSSKGKERAEPQTVVSRMRSADLTDHEDPYRPPHKGKSKQPAKSRRKREETPSDVDNAPPMDPTLQRPKKPVVRKRGRGTG
ncbi:hypothetical protein EV359DRAFT_68774, partial [Lentinula novae-zelandiae]